jgi:hypothetical protein
MKIASRILGHLIFYDLNRLKVYNLRYEGMSGINKL